MDAALPKLGIDFVMVPTLGMDRLDFVQFGMVGCHYWNLDHGIISLDAKRHRAISLDHGATALSQFGMVGCHYLNWIMER
jgi:hypothetical protein